MKCFWYLLIGLCLLMCSCKSKEVVTGYSNRLQVKSEASFLNESVKIDTSRTSYFAKEIQSIVIEEDITVTEYDKESGKPMKETKTKRKAVQDSNEVVSTEEEKRVSEVRNDSLKHSADMHDVMEGESETVTNSNGLESFGKWLGIVLGIFLVAAILRLINRMKKKKPS